MSKIWILGIVFALVPFAAPAADGNRYGGEDRGKPLLPARVDALWQKECSSCHIAYPPGLLPAASWRNVMSTLDRHFGTDASLSVQERDGIAAFLVANASNRWTASTAPLRITESQWFKAKHGREIAPEVWKRAAVKTRANCQACHAGAAEGDFNERQIRIPK